MTQWIWNCLMCFDSVWALSWTPPWPASAKCRTFLTLAKSPPRQSKKKMSVATLTLKSWSTRLIILSIVLLIAASQWTNPLIKTGQLIQVWFNWSTASFSKASWPGPAIFILSPAKTACLCAFALTASARKFLSYPRPIKRACWLG